MTKSEAEAYFHAAIKDGAMAPEELEGLSDFAYCELADRMAAKGDQVVEDMIENEIDDIILERDQNESDNESDEVPDMGPDDVDPRPTEEEFNARQ